MPVKRGVVSKSHTFMFAQASHLGLPSSKPLKPSPVKMHTPSWWGMEGGRAQGACHLAGLPCLAPHLSLATHRDQPTGDVLVQHEFAPDQHVHTAEPECVVLDRREHVRAGSSHPGALSSESRSQGASCQMPLPAQMGPSEHQAPPAPWRTPQHHPESLCLLSHKMSTETSGSSSA